VKDYSYPLKETTFLKRYSVEKDKVYAKYAKDDIILYPKTEHNIIALDRQLERQLIKIKEYYEPELKFKIRTLKTLIPINVYLNLSYTPDIIRNCLEREDIFLAILALLVNGGASLCLILDFIKNTKRLQEITDMDYVNEILKDIVLENIEDLELTEEAKEQLIKTGKVNLSNIDSFTHKDIEKIKQFIKQKNIDK